MRAPLFSSALVGSAAGGAARRGSVPRARVAVRGRRHATRLGLCAGGQGLCLPAGSTQLLWRPEAQSAGAPYRRPQPLDTCGVRAFHSATTY